MSNKKQTGTATIKIGDEEFKVNGTIEFDEGDLPGPKDEILVIACKGVTLEEIHKKFVPGLPSLIYCEDGPPHCNFMVHSYSCEVVQDNGDREIRLKGWHVL